MQKVNYSTNPRSYAQLLASGITPKQIREAINSGLNPSQLPPEYFGMSGGYTPQSVGPGASPSPQMGGIDIPPANMNDPYAYTPSGGPGSMGAFGTTPNMGFPSNFDIGGYLPSSSDAYLGIPGAAGNSGSISPMGGNPMGFSGGITPDWWNLPSSDQSMWTMPDYSSGYGYDPGAYGYMSSPAELSYSEPSPIPFYDPVSMGSMGGPEGLLDPFQTPPSDLFAPLPTDYSSLGVPGSESGGINASGEGEFPGGPGGIDASGSAEFPGTGGIDAGGSAEFPTSGVNAEGTALPSPNYGYAPPPDALQPGITPGYGTGVFASVGGPFSSPGFAGPQFSGSGVAPGWTSMYSGPKGLTAGLGVSAALGSQTGGFMPVGGGGYNKSLFSPDSWLDAGAVGDREQIKALKPGSPFAWDDYVALAKPGKQNASTNWLMSQSFQAPPGVYDAPTPSKPKGKGK